MAIGLLCIRALEHHAWGRGWVQRAPDNVELDKQLPRSSALLGLFTLSTDVFPPHFFQRAIY